MSLRPRRPFSYRTRGGVPRDPQGISTITGFAPQKLKPEPDPEGRERCSDRQDRACPDPPPVPSPPSATVTVTNSVDLNDSREINFEYLKHVVLKFMSSREAEVSCQSRFFKQSGSGPHLTRTCFVFWSQAFQLIRAVSVLLHFTREEEDMLKQTLEYKVAAVGCSGVWLHSSAAQPQSDWGTFTLTCLTGSFGW